MAEPATNGDFPRASQSDVRMDLGESVSKDGHVAIGCGDSVIVALHRSCQ